MSGMREGLWYFQAKKRSGVLFSVLKTKLVRARMDQSSRKVYISSTMHRTFGRPQWQQLRDLLYAWKVNLSGVQEGMKAIAAAHMEMSKQ